MPHFFVTGTDTGVGKTWFTCWLTRGWIAQGTRAAALKPIAAGDREDAILLRAAANDNLSLDEINPLSLREPAAPLVGARAENRVLDFDALNRSIFATAARFPQVAVEGVGGWRVPLAPGYEVRDWARALGWPVVVVARAGLGTLNHTLLTVDSIRATGLTCAGVVLNPGRPQRETPDDSASLARRTNGDVLRNLLGLPLLELDRLVETAYEIPLWLGGK